MRAGSNELNDTKNISGMAMPYMIRMAFIRCMISLSGNKLQASLGKGTESAIERDKCWLAGGRWEVGGDGRRHKKCV